MLNENSYTDIKKIRIGLGFSQADLAKKIGVRQSVISKIENNSQTISIDVILKISNVLEICPYSLINLCNNCFNRGNCKKRIIKIR